MYKIAGGANMLHDKWAHHEDAWEQFHRLLKLVEANMPTVCKKVGGRLQLVWSEVHNILVCPSISR